MKTTLQFLIILLLLGAIACTGNKSGVPDVVLNAFNTKFQNTSQIEWEKESDDEWEVEFELNGIEFSAKFSSKEDWLETESRVKKHELPQMVLIVLNLEFKSYQIREIEYCETPDGNFYEVELENEDLKLEVSISPEGTILKTEKTEEDIDEEEQDDDD